jgi:hypothetical protein
MTKTITLTFLLFLSVLILRAQTPVINEVDYDQPGIDSAEFIELYNTDVANPANLLNYVVILFNGSTSAVYDSIVMPSFLLTNGVYYVICNSSGTVPNCNLTHGTAIDMIQNGAPDAIALKHRISQTIVDAISYEGNCIAPYIEGTGAAADNGNNAGVSLSRYPNGADTQNNSADFHVACSTPGASNVANTSGCVVASVNEVRNISHLYVYPNPASGMISIFGMPSSSQVWNVAVYDATGKLCLSASFEAVNNILHLNIESLPNGIYEAVVSNAGYSAKQRLVVAR